MPDKPKLNHGPWLEIFSGRWSGYEVHLFENPEKMTLLTIDEKKGAKTTGMVVTLNKYFVVGGDTSRLLKNLGGHSLVFEKNYPSFKRKYLSLSSGPMYADLKKGEPNEAVDEAFAKVEGLSERALELGHGLGADLVELKNADEEEISHLFAEPTLLHGIAIGEEREAAPIPEPARTSEMRGIMAVLGKKITGGDAELSLDKAASTIIIGQADSRKHAIQVLMESCVLNGISVVVFDEDGSFEKMSSPNHEFDYESYPNLQPIGMPLKSISLTVDLNLLDIDMLKEILGISSEKEALGKTAMEMISRVLKEESGRMQSLSDVEERLLTIQDEAKKFHIYRAVRIVKVCDRAFAGVFAGKMNQHTFISPYSKSTGSINRVDVSGIPLNLKKAFALSLIKSIAGDATTVAPEMKLMVFFVRGADIAPAEPKKRLDEALAKVLQECNGAGIGFCLGAQHGIDLNSMILQKSSLTIDLITREEAAVKEADGRAYRMKTRPTISAA